MDGEGNFNWRFIFPFCYIPAEDVVVVKRKKHVFSLDKSEEHYKPTLILQVWDNDLFSADDFLGTIELNLTKLPMPAKTKKNCNLETMNLRNGKNKTINLFECKRLKGLWPFVDDSDGECKITVSLFFKVLQFLFKCFLFNCKFLNDKTILNI